MKFITSREIQEIKNSEETIRAVDELGETTNNVKNFRKIWLGARREIEDYIENYNS